MSEGQRKAKALGGRLREQFGAQGKPLPPDIVEVLRRLADREQELRDDAAAQRDRLKRRDPG